MTQIKSDSNESTRFLVHEALILGVCLYLCMPRSRPSQSIPLFNFYPEVFLQIVLPMIFSIIIFILLFEKKYLKKFLILALVGSVITSTYQYSAIFAFNHVAIVVIVFNLFYLKQSDSNKRLASQFFLCFLFLFAGLQKINPDYLSGKEFIAGGDFAVYYESWLGRIIPGELPAFLKILPAISIVIELVIAAGILIRPIIFTHIIFLFLLVLSLLHPPVFFVYILILPLLLLIHKDLNELLNTSIFNSALKSPFFWTLFILAVMNRPEIFTVALTANIIFVTILIFFHIYFLFQDPTLFTSSTFNFTNFKNWRLFAIISLMIAIYIGSYFILPSPYGFKMFSSSRFKIPYYQLMIESPDACKLSRTKWMYSNVTDSRWSAVDSRQCFIQFPTESGLEYVKQEICENFSESTFVLKNSSGATLKNMSCVN